MRRVKWWAATLGLAVLAGPLLAVPPAAAEHTVTWGAGSECGTAARQATTAVNTPVRLVACVTLGGSPLPDWRMTLVVKGPNRTVESQITTDASGVVRFGVQPTAPGTTTVTLCDDDGCLYGETDLTVTPADAATTTSTTAATTPTTADDRSESGGGGSSAGWWVGLVVLLLFLAATQRGMLAMPIGGEVADPCARYREQVRRRQAERDAAEQRRQQTERRVQQIKEALDRLRNTQGVGSLGDLETDLLLAEADAEAAGQQRIRATDALQAAQNDLARCERGEVMVAPGEEPEPTPAATPGAGEEPVPCCEGRMWIGVNVSCGGQALVAGAEGGCVYLFCVDNMDRSATILWQGTRWGPGLGGGAAAAIFMVYQGPEHPNELPAVVARILEGFDWDLSLGGSLSKIGRAGVTAVRQRRVLQMLRRLWAHANTCGDLKRARKAGDDLKLFDKRGQFRTMMREFDQDGTLRELADKLGEAAVKGSTSRAQAGGGGVNIPFGVGLQVGAWNLTGVKTELFDVEGCPQCDPSSTSRD